MSKKFVLLSLAVMMTAMGALAQNARMAALNNVSIIPDVSQILVNPAYITTYPDLLQGTFDGTVAGTNVMVPFIITKSIGDKFTAGLTQNGNTLVPGVYTTMIALLAPPFPATGITAINPIPHVLGGMNLDPIKIGADLYWERAFYNSKVTDDNGATPVVTTITTTSASFSNPGLVLGATVDQNELPLRAYLGFSLPMLNGKTETSVTGGNDVTTTIASQMSYATKLGLEVAPKLNEFDWTSGALYSVLYYGRSKTTTETVTPPPGVSTTVEALAGNHTFSHYWRVYSGLTKLLESQNVLFSGLMSLNLQSDITKPDVFGAINYNPGRTSLNTMWLSIHAAAEKEWNQLKMLDAIQARVGLDYTASDVVGHQKGDTAAFSHLARIQNAAAHSGVTGTLGLGMSKNVFQLDLQIMPVELLNVFKLVNGTMAAATAPNDLARATLTLDFGGGTKKTGSQSSTSSTPASMESAPAVAPAPTPSF